MERMKGDRPVLELKVSGPNIRRGRIPLPELIKICQQAQKAVLRQAEALEGKRTLHPGPANATIVKSCTLELVGVKGGSTRLQFSPAQQQVPLPEAPTLVEDAVSELGDVFHSLGNGGHKQIDPGVLRAVYEFSGVIEPHGINRIEWISKAHKRRKRNRAMVDSSTKERAAARFSDPEVASVSVDGILDEADFKPGVKKCRIDPAVGASINCTFEPEKEDLIYELLRKPVRITGKGRRRSYTERIESVHVDDIRLLHSLEMGREGFYANLSIDELAQLQEVKALRNLKVLSGGIPEDEDVDTFLQDIYESRK